jgi:c-di-GMP-related signal transduction protein
LKYLYIARQPIFDRSMNVVAYELLYRSSDENFYSCEDGDKATLAVINNTTMGFSLSELTQGKRAFINFTRKLICDEAPTMFDPSEIAIEVLEDIVPDDELRVSLSKLRDMGYMIALDDFVYGTDHDALLHMTDIVKVDFIGSDKSDRKRIIEENVSRDMLFLAEKVETREDFEHAMELGYHFFQGYFFAKPSLLKKPNLKPIGGAAMGAAIEVAKEDPDIRKLAEMVESDLSLSYKLLKFVNSPVYRGISRISSIYDAIVRLGIVEMKKWISIIILIGFSDKAPSELISCSLIRSRLFKALSVGMGNEHMQNDSFFVGMFSMIDVIMERPIDEILSELPLSDRVKEALMGMCPQSAIMLRIVESYEMGDWLQFEKLCRDNGVDPKTISAEYCKAVSWVSDMSSCVGID